MAAPAPPPPAYADPPTFPRSAPHHSQALRNWRPKLDALSPAAALQAYGLHGLLLGVVLSAKLARYGHHDHLTLRLEAARLAARLAAAAFAGHAGHPQRRLGFATYTPHELWAAGADAWLLWADPYRCPVGDLLGALEATAAALLDAGLALDALPVLALWEHVACHVTRSLHATVWCRLVRVRALVALGLLTEAVALCGELMAAQRLPDPLLDSAYVLKEPSGAVVAVRESGAVRESSWWGAKGGTACACGPRDRSCGATSRSRGVFVHTWEGPWSPCASVAYR
jgi:hypothetical protein